MNELVININKDQESNKRSLSVNSNLGMRMLLIHMIPEYVLTMFVSF
jgi:hypothetical protein